MKRDIIFPLLIISFIITANSAFCTTFSIPLATLQIARETMGLNRSFNSKKVRVGIGNQSFSKYVWEYATIYSTGEFELYNNKTYIGSYNSSDEINIKMVGKIFVLTDKNNEVISKVSGPVKFKNGFGFLGIKDLKRGGKNALYRGDLELVCPNVGQFHIINSLEVEDYLKGVVPNEMPVHFGLEALKAQAVAARNYVLSPRVKANPNYDVVDSVASQVYFGANTEKELSNRAVEETSGIVALYDWDLILALYSSTAGGYTESYENAFSDPYTKIFPAQPKPYLKSVPDKEDFGVLNTDQEAEKFYTSRPKSYDNESRYYRWEKEWTQKELQQEVQNHIAAQSDAGFVSPKVNKGEIIGKITRLNVLQRGFSGKIMKLQIETENGNYTVEKELVIRRLFTEHGKALPSANLVFKQEFDDNGNLAKIKAYGGGYGHGVGMSQYGAGYMATSLKAPYEKILQHYYSGISLTTEPFILSSDNEQKEKTQTFYSKDKNATLVIDNKYGVGYVDTIINGEEQRIELDCDCRINRIELQLQKGINTVKFIYPLNYDNRGLRMYIELVGANEYSD